MTVMLSDAGEEEGGGGLAGGGDVVSSNEWWWGRRIRWWRAVADREEGRLAVGRWRRGGVGTESDTSSRGGRRKRWRDVVDGGPHWRWGRCRRCGGRRHGEEGGVAVAGRGGVGWVGVGLGLGLGVSVYW